MDVAIKICGNDYYLGGNCVLMAQTIFKREEDWSHVLCFYSIFLLMPTRLWGIIMQNYIELRVVLLMIVNVNDRCCMRCEMIKEIHYGITKHRRWQGENVQIVFHRFILYNRASQSCSVSLWHSAMEMSRRLLTIRKLKRQNRKLQKLHLMMARKIMRNEELTNMEITMDGHIPCPIIQSKKRRHWQLSRRFQYQFLNTRLFTFLKSKKCTCLCMSKFQNLIQFTSMWVVEYATDERSQN